MSLLDPNPSLARLLLVTGIALTVVTICSWAAMRLRMRNQLNDHTVPLLPIPVSPAPTQHNDDTETIIPRNADEADTLAWAAELHEMNHETDAGTAELDPLSSEWDLHSRAQVPPHLFEALIDETGLTFDTIDPLSNDWELWKVELEPAVLAVQAFEALARRTFDWSAPTSEHRPLAIAASA